MLWELGSEDCTVSYQFYYTNDKMVLALPKTTCNKPIWCPEIMLCLRFAILTEKIKQTVKIDASSVEIEERGVKLRLTVVDTPGFGDSLNTEDW